MSSTATTTLFVESLKKLEFDYPVLLGPEQDELSRALFCPFRELKTVVFVVEDEKSSESNRAHDVRVVVKCVERDMVPKNTLSYLHIIGFCVQVDDQEIDPIPATIFFLPNDITGKFQSWKK